MTCARNVIACRSRHATPIIVAAVLAMLVPVAGGCGDGAAPRRCQLDPECAAGEICSIGECVPGCRVAEDRCPAGFDCVGGTCCPEIDGGVACDAGADGGCFDASPETSCPGDMVSIEDEFCIDRFEASRPDATGTTGGADHSRATSRPGVVPWYPVTLDLARAACTCAGKRMCTPEEVTGACQGPDHTTYPYGDEYDPVVCNSIDTYCRCGAETACAEVAECPYPHCYNRPPEGQSEPATGCGAAPHASPTGGFWGCTNEYGAYDLSGNVWELVDDGTATGHFRAGAYNCIDSETLHQCDYAATNISAKGFRCCRDLTPR